MYSRRNAGVPNWFVMLVGIAFVFGAYYLWTGLRSYIESGGRSAAEATRQANADMTATQVRLRQLEASLPTPRPTSTPRPECQDFVVIVPSAVMRSAPSTSASFLRNVEEGAIVCVMGRHGNTDWYLVDREPITRRVEEAYMRSDVIRAVAPTPTPSNTSPPPPTITATYTESPTMTLTIDPDVTPSATPTPTMIPSPLPTETPPAVSL